MNTKLARNFFEYSALLYLTLLMLSSLMIKSAAQDMMNALILLLPFAGFYFYKKKLSRDEKIFSIFGLLISFYAVFSYFYHPNTEFSGAKLTIQAKYLLVLSVIFLMHISKMNIKKFILMNAIVSIIAGVFTAYHLIYKGYPYPTGLFKVRLIPFGNLALLSAIISLSCSVYIKDKSWKIALFFAFLLGSYASFGSGTRGGWIALPFMLIIPALLALQQYSTKKSLGIVILLSIALLGAWGTNTFKIKSTILEGYNNTTNYFSKGTSSTSMGYRLEMWKAGLMAFEKNPIFGIGFGNTNNWLNELIKEKKVNPNIHGFKHFHSSYIDSLANRGLAGTLIVVAFIFWVLFFSIRQIRHSDNQQKLIGFLSLLVLGSYLLFSLTDSFFDLTLTIPYLIISLSCLIYIAGNLQKKQTNHSGEIEHQQS